MTSMEPEFILIPQPRTADGARVHFECLECGHEETFVRLHYADVAHVLGSDHYWGECPEVHWKGEQAPEVAAHRRELAARHRNT